MFCPAWKFRFDVCGWAVPDGHTVMYPAVLRVDHGHVRDHRGHPGGRDPALPADLHVAVPTPAPGRSICWPMRESTIRAGVSGATAPAAVGVPAQDVAGDVDDQLHGAVGAVEQLDLPVRRRPGPAPCSGWSARPGSSGSTCSAGRCPDGHTVMYPAVLRGDHGHVHHHRRHPGAGDPALTGDLHHAPCPTRPPHRGSADRPGNRRSAPGSPTPPPPPPRAHATTAAPACCVAGDRSADAAGAVTAPATTRARTEINTRTMGLHDKASPGTMGRRTARPGVAGRAGAQPTPPARPRRLRHARGKRPLARSLTRLTASILTTHRGLSDVGARRYCLRCTTPKTPDVTVHRRSRTRCAAVAGRWVPRFVT